MRAKIAVPIKSIQKLHLSPKSCQAADAVSAGWKGFFEDMPSGNLSANFQSSKVDYLF